MYFYSLTNIFANTNSILKVNPSHLANTLTNTNNKADNFTKKEIWLRPIISSFLITRWRLGMITSYLNN